MFHQIQDVKKTATACTGPRGPRWQAIAEEDEKNSASRLFKQIFIRVSLDGALLWF
jgi:hypothetical protein